MSKYVAASRELEGNLLFESEFADNRQKLDIADGDVYKNIKEERVVVISTTISVEISTTISVAISTIIFATISTTIFTTISGATFEVEVLVDDKEYDDERMEDKNIKAYD